MAQNTVILVRNLEGSLLLPNSNTRIFCSQIQELFPDLRFIPPNTRIGFEVSRKPLLGGVELLIDRNRGARRSSDQHWFTGWVNDSALRILDMRELPEKPVTVYARMNISPRDKPLDITLHMHKSGSAYVLPAMGGMTEQRMCAEFELFLPEVHQLPDGAKFDIRISTQPLPNSAKGEEPYTLLVDSDRFALMTNGFERYLTCDILTHVFGIPRNGDQWAYSKFWVQYSPQGAEKEAPKPQPQTEPQPTMATPMTPGQKAAATRKANKAKSSAKATVAKKAIATMTPAQKAAATRKRNRAASAKATVAKKAALTPGQKAAITRKANKAKSAANG